MKTKIAIQSRFAKGFTLVELLVSITILSLILLFLGQAIGLVSRVWVEGIGAVDNFTKARVIMNLLDRDVQSMVMRQDTAAFVDQTGTKAACAFFTNIQGYSTSTDTRSLSLVQYMLNPSAGTTPDAMATLGRLNYGMNFAATPVIPAIATPSPASLTQLTQFTATGTETVATGVIQFQWQFVDGAGNIVTPTAATPFSYNYAAPSAPGNARAIIISVIVLNNSAFKLASQNPAIFTTLQSDFPSTLPAVTPPPTFSQYWNGILNPTSGTLDTTLPPRVRAGLKVFQRYVPLPTPAP